MQRPQGKEVATIGVIEQYVCWRFRIAGDVRAFEGANRTRKHDRGDLVPTYLDLVNRPVIERELLDGLVIRGGLREGRNGEEEREDY